ncbi:MAG: hypothetical protein LH624_13530 [Cryobacterium sp.]|nr:hypothetical protein [Cryobacterium sp.]
MAEHLVELDDRRRLSLGRIGRAEHTRYLVAEEPDGTLVLTPAVVMSELEAKLLANSELVERIQANRADPRRLVRRGRGTPAASG